MMQQTMQPHIIVISETWLTENVSDDQIILPGFGPPFRCDRQGGRRGGGVCVYIRENLACTLIPDLDAPRLRGECERLFIKIKGTDIILTALYVPPNLSRSEQEIISTGISDTLERFLSESPHASLLVAGDLNDLSLEDLEHQFSLSQVVQSPTRNDAILDKILLDTKLSDMYATPIVGPNLSTSDHRTVFMPPIKSKTNIMRIKKVFDFRESNVPLFVNHITSYNWSNFYRSNIDVDSKTDILYDRVNKALALIPTDFVEMTSNDKPWLTPKLKLLINKRFNAYRSKDWPLFNHLKTKIKKEIINAKSAWLQKSSSTSSGLWKAARAIQNKGHSNSLASLLQNFRSIPDAVEDINRSFAEYFSAAPDWSSIMENIKMIADTRVSDTWNPSINVQLIYEELRGLQIKKAGGSDGLPPRLLVAGAEIFAPILTHLISLSIETRRVPRQWKIANIVPIPKKRNPSIHDLRPISLLPIFAKICEKVVLSSIKERLCELFGREQFGFRPKSSTVLSHIKLHDFITAQLEAVSTKGVLLISFDMRRAFDSLNHEALMQTLCGSNLPIGFVQWCADYLQNRQQAVILENMSSTLLNITSGVPQGSVISPFLFCLQMKTAMPLAPQSIIIKYADDFLVAIPVPDLAEIPSITTKEIDHMTKWCSENGLYLNLGKTKSLLIPKKCQISASDSLLSTSSDLKILGVIYNANCTWSSHVTHLTKKASQMIYIIRQMKMFLPKSLLFQVYFGLIRSRLEYCNAVFVGLSIRESAQLEKVQQRCHRIICGRGCDCDLPTLLTRRINMATKIFKDMSYTHHILHDMYPSLLPHGKRFALTHARTNRRLNSFVPYCSRLCNSITDL